ncbi:murein biosynthesis integral membrane protein MurJ [Psychrilyobacter atlanticus]|uniref:murein biosynthesis integral membrane protein MurJ n=1 Tax=Psychrilyobacter atlanticus TaxID=271091 RepID=UPI0004279E8F|nr:murein biosynthesis integral membrane protein MurJ [Psychrilyobacter atlanticus]
MKTITILLMMLAIITKISGFGRDVVLSYYYGVSNITDAYLVAITIPTVIFSFIGIGISTNLIPMYNNIKKEKGIQDAEKFINDVINFSIILCSLIVMIAFPLSGGIVRVIAPGLCDQTLNLAIDFTKITIIGIYFSVGISIFTGYLHLKKSFIAPTLMGIPLNVIMIIFIAISHNYSIQILSIGSVLSLAFQFLFLIPFAYKQGYSYSFELDRNNPYLKKMVLLSIPVIIGVSVNQINVLIDKSIASRMIIGSISALTYANRMNLFVKGIFISTIASLMYPTLSKMSAENNVHGYKKTLIEAINVINLLVIPISIISMMFSEIIIKLIFGRGAFNSTAVLRTAHSLIFYSIGMIGIGHREILSRAFYSLQDTKTPMINAVTGVVVNIIFNIVLSDIMGIKGLALASSIAAVSTSLLLTISLRKKIGSFGLKNMTLSFIKILCASIITGMLSKIFYNYLIKNMFKSSLALFVSLLAGVFIYIFLVLLMKVDEVEKIVGVIKKKMRNYKKVVEVKNEDD